MQVEAIIRSIRSEEGPEAKRLIYAVAHELMEPQMALDGLIELWEGWGIFTDLDDIQKNYLENGGVFLVAEVGGRMVGTGAFACFSEGQVFSTDGRLRTQDESLRTGRGVCTLRRIMLLPEYRGHKLGYALMLELTRRAREMGYSKMILWTDPIKLHHAVDFYHQLGFYDLAIQGMDADEIWLGMDI